VTAFVRLLVGEEQASSDVVTLAGQLLRLAHQAGRDVDVSHEAGQLLPRSLAVLAHGTTKADLAMAEICAYLADATRCEQIAEAIDVRSGRWATAVRHTLAHRAEVWRNEAAVVATDAAFYELVTLARA